MGLNLSGSPMKTTSRRGTSALTGIRPSPNVAEREQVIDTVKAASVRGTLAKDEFDLRVSQAFASRTYAELTAVTAGTCTKIQKGADLHADRQFLRALSRHTGWQADDDSHHRGRCARSRHRWWRNTHA